MRGHLSPSRGGSAAGVAVPAASDAQAGNSSNQRLRLVLLEEGTSMPDSLGAKGDTVLVVQGVAERPLGFALRAVQQVLAIEQSGRSIGHAHVPLAPRSGPEVWAARSLIDRVLITHAASLGAGVSEPLLRAHRRSYLELQHSLPYLMEAMIGESSTGVMGNGTPFAPESDGDGQ